MSRFITLWGKRMIEVLLFTAILWGIFIHNAFWAISSSVLFSLLASAFCIWAGLHLFAQDTWSQLSRKPQYAPARPSDNVRSGWIWTPIFLLYLLVIFQTVPLPIPLVELLSPKRAEIAQIASEALPELETNALTLSVDPIMTRRMMPYFLFPLITFWLGNILVTSRRRARRIIFILILVALVESIYGLVEQLSGHGHVLWIPVGNNEVVGTFLNRNHFAALLSLFLPATIGWLYFHAIKANTHRTRGNIIPSTSWDILNSRQGLWLFAPGILVLGIIQSHSRGGFSSMLLGIALMFGAGLRAQIARTFSAIAIILALIIVAFTINSDLEMVMGRFDNMAEDQGSGRITIWRDSLGVLDDYPLFGIGLGNFPNAYRQHEEQSSTHSPRRAHNEWLEGLIVFGYPGMALLALALIACFVKSFKIIRRAEKDKPWLLGIWCGLVGLALHSFVEFTVHSPGIINVAALLMGLLLGFERHISGRNRWDFKHLEKLRL